VPRTPREGWLPSLVAAELGRYDPGAALSRLPAEARAETSGGDLVPAAALLVARSLRPRLEPRPSNRVEAFLDETRLHVHLALDLSLLGRAPLDATRRLPEIAAFLAATAGAHPEALAVRPGEARKASARAVGGAFAVAEEALVARLYPPGDPAHGLPLHAGTVAVFRRRLARVATGFLREGRLDPEALERHADYAARESAALAEALAGLLDAAAASGPIRKLWVRQVARLGLAGAVARDARRAVAAPRPAAALAAATPARARPFLVEQLFAARLRTRAAGGADRYLEDFAAATGLEPHALAAAQVEAAAQHGDHQVWFDALGERIPGEHLAGTVDWQAVADGWGSAADSMVERVSSAVSDNLEAVATEIRETGELGVLLAKAASGGTLTADEKRKVRAQLVDLAKAVPALAIFAAPGGMLLLPLLAKLLPFSLAPSAWNREKGLEPAASAPPGDDASKKWRAG
jgi:hypothetical protein